MWEEKKKASSHDKVHVISDGKESSADSPRLMDLAILPVFYLNSAESPYKK